MLWERCETVGAYERPLSLRTHHHSSTRVPQIVERLVGHTAGQRAIAHHGDDLAVTAVANRLAA